MCERGENKTREKEGERVKERERETDLVDK